MLYRILLFSVKPQHESAVSIHICPFATIIQHHSGCPSYSNQRRKRKKRNPDWKRSKTLTVCRCHDPLHAAKWLQPCPTLWNTIGASPPGFPIPGILQARTLEWVAISFSNAWKWSHSVVSDSLQLHGLQPTRLLCPWDFPGKSTGVGCHCHLQSST